MATFWLVDRTASQQAALLRADVVSRTQFRGRERHAMATVGLPHWTSRHLAFPDLG